MPRRHKTASHRSGFEKRNGWGQGHQIDVRASHFGITTESTGVVKHWKTEIEADVLVSGLALLKSSATVIEWDSNSVSLLESGHTCANLFHNSAELVTENDWRLGRDAQPRPTSVPQVMVRQTDAVGLNLDNSVIGTALRVRPVRVDDKGLGNFFNNCGFQENLLWSCKYQNQ